MTVQFAPTIGFHVAGTLNGVGDYMRRIDEAGLPFAICSVGEGGLIGEACQYTNADHWIVYRQNHDNSGHELDLPLWSGNASNYTETPEHFTARLIAALNTVPQVSANKDRVWIGVLNECDQLQADWLHSFSLEVARLMNAGGWRVVLLNWATGTPQIGSLGNPPHLELLRYAGANRDKCALGIHEYSLDADLFNDYPYLVGRWQFYADVCKAHNIPLPQFIVKEFGWFAERTSGLGESAEIDAVRELMRRDDPTIPRMLWSSKYWHGTILRDVQNLVQPVTNFVLSERFDHEPLPPDEGEPIMSSIDLWDYFRSDGLIRPHVASWMDYGEFPYRAMSENGDVYHVSGSLWRRWYADENFIYLDLDVSQSQIVDGGGTAELMFALFEDEKLGSAWLPRHMKVGETFERLPSVFHFYRATCKRADDLYEHNGSQPPSSITLLKHGSVRLPNGIVLDDCIQLGNPDGTGELHTLARNLGLVWWENLDNGNESFLYSTDGDIATSDSRVKIRCLNRISGERYYRNESPVAPPIVEPQPVPEPPKPEPAEVAPPDHVYQFDPLSWSLYREVYRREMFPASAEWDAADGYRRLYAVNTTGGRAIFRAPIGKWEPVELEIIEHGDSIEPPAPEFVIADVVDDMPRDSSVRFPFKSRTLDRIQYVTIHHTVSQIGSRAIAQYHISNNEWESIGYHFVIYADGSIEQVNRLTTVSWHDRNNYDSVGVAMIGNFMEVPPTDAQIDSARFVVEHLQGTLERGLFVRGHRDAPGNKTSCPGDTYLDWIGRITL